MYDLAGDPYQTRNLANLTSQSALRTSLQNELNLKKSQLAYVVPTYAKTQPF